MNSDEMIGFEDRSYLNPTTSRDEQLAFLDTLRETQAQNTAQVNADTYALGSQLPSNLGGLSGAEDTFIARYQTPQTEQTVADLRTAAQASALNTALSNLQEAWRKRYNDAILDYQRRSTNGDPATTPDSSGLGVNTNPNGSGDLGVREDQDALDDYEALNKAALDAAMQKAIAAQNSGNSLTKNSTVFRFNSGNTVKYGVVHRDGLNQITGLEVDGTEYTADAGLEYLQRLLRANNLYNAAGKQMTDLLGF